MKFDELYEYFSETLLEKFEGKKKVKEFPADTSSIGGLPYYGKGGKNLKKKDSPEEERQQVTQQQIDTYKKIFDELSKRDEGFDYNNMVAVAKRIFISQGQNSTTAGYNARGFTTAIINSLQDIGGDLGSSAENVVSASNNNSSDEERKSKFDDIANNVQDSLGSNLSLKDGYFSVLKMDDEELKEKMKPLFRREDFERTDAFGIVNTLRTEPAGYFNLQKLLDRLDEDGELTGTLTKNRVLNTIEKLIKNNIITASEVGISSGEDSGVPALDPVDDSGERVHFKSDEAERIAARSSGDIYKKPRYRDPEHRDREDEPYM